MIRTSLLRRMRQSAIATATAAAVAIGLAGCSPIDLINAAAPKSTFSKLDGLPYGPDARQKLDVYLPSTRRVNASVNSRDKPPLVVFFYGGSWQHGKRGDYLFVGEALASRGYVVVVPDYRLYPQTAFPGFIEDAAAAVRWAREHAHDYGADPTRLFLVGHSAGAQMTALLATDSRYLAAQGIGEGSIAGMIGLAGPYDFLPLRDATLEKIFPPAIREASQPIAFVRGDEPPMILMVGTKDVTVDPGNTDRFAARLKAAGDSVEVRRYDGINHAMIVGSLAAPLRAVSSVLTVAPVLDDMTHFIDTH